MAALQTLRSDGSWLLPAAGAPPDIAGVLALSANGHCVFHRDGCEIQRALGHRLVPSACQHFPREVLIDRRGVFVTLSHYCPTAADLLFDHQGAVHIVEGPRPLPDGEPEGLDARGVLPPLLVDGVLMDDDGYDAWERHMIQALTQDDSRTPEEAVAGLRRDVAILQRWRPGTLSLSAEIAQLPEAQCSGSAKSPKSDSAEATVVDETVIIRRYLAARAFASWMAYEGRGLAAVVGSLALILRVLRQQLATMGEAAPSRDRLTQAIRQTDLLLVHQMPRAELASRAHAQYQ